MNLEIREIRAVDYISENSNLKLNGIFVDGKLRYISGNHGHHIADEYAALLVKELKDVDAISL